MKDYSKYVGKHYLSIEDKNNLFVYTIIYENGKYGLDVLDLFLPRVAVYKDFGFKNDELDIFIPELTKCTTKDVEILEEEYQFLKKEILTIKELYDKYIYLAKILIKKVTDGLDKKI